jgi:lysophospholipid acyltransferase
MITFLTSAFWHGIAGGYYLAFAFAGFIQTAMKLMRSHVRPLFLQAPSATAQPGPNGKPPAPAPTALKPLYDAASIVVSILVLNYTASPFMLLSIKDSLRCWAALGWYGNVLVFGALAFFWSGGARLLGTAKPERKAIEKQTKGDVKPAAMKE